MFCRCSRSRRCASPGSKSMAGFSVSSAESARWRLTQPSLPGSDAGAGPEDFAGGHELVQHGRLVVGNPAGQDQRLPGGGRNGHAGELVDGRDDAVQAAQRGLPAAAGRSHVLPGGKEPAVGGGVHGFHFGAERCERTAAQFAEHLGVAPFAHGGRRQKGRQSGRRSYGQGGRDGRGAGFLDAGSLVGRRTARRGCRWRGVRPELAFHHAAVRGQPLQRRADDGDAESQPRRGLGGGEGPVRAGVARDEVAERVRDRFDEGQRHAHGQRHAEGIAEPGGVLDRRKALGTADVDLDGPVGPLQGGEVGGGVGVRRLRMTAFAAGASTAAAATGRLDGLSRGGFGGLTLRRGRRRLQPGGDFLRRERTQEPQEVRDALHARAPCGPVPGAAVHARWRR